MRASVCAAISLLSYVAPSFALWPLPTEMSTGESTLKLGGDFSITLSGIEPVPEDLQQAVERTEKQLREDALEILEPDRGAARAEAIQNAPSLTSLTVTLQLEGDVKSITEEAQLALEERQESYTLEVPEDGSEATLSANSTLGLFRGLTTFSQLFYDLEGTQYTVEAPISITDAPAYPYRGFMLDTARNYFPVDDIKRTLDAMSWVKLNTFHWHIVDSQSFPLQLPDFPELAETGAYSQKMVYSVEDIADITSYAGARGIDVIPEIDTPGHTSIISLSHPEHIACPVASPWQTYAAEPPSGQIRIANEDAVSFTADLLTAASNLFPGRYFSTGGDEVNAACYEDDTETQNQLTARGITIEQALDTFTQEVHGALHDLDKTTVVWQEMVLDHNVTLKNDTLIMVWISSADAAAVVGEGHRIVHAPSDYFYLDCGGGGWLGDYPQGNSWCDPFKTWQKIYSFDPMANITSENAHLVMGGQSLVWAEQTSPYNLDSQIWPRAASAAEVFWSGPGGDVAAAYPRIHDVAFRMNQRGVGAIALQPLWCALRPGLCDLTA